MNYKLILSIAVLFIAISTTAQIDRSKMPKPDKTPEIKLGTPYTFTLKNGLTVMVVEDHKLPRVTITLNTDNFPFTEGDKAGLGNITAGVVGNGTTSIPKDNFNEEIDFLGASLNVNAERAFAQSLSKYTERIMELLADAIINPLYSEEELDAEKKKLIESLKMGESSVPAVADRVNDVLLYGKNHPKGEFITEETVNNINLEDVKKHFSTFMVPGSAYMVISGDISAKKAKKLAKKYFSNWKGTTPAKTTLPEVKNVTLQVNFVDMPNAVQSELAVMNAADIKMADTDHHAAKVANYILGGAFGSYLNLNLREKHGFTYGARSSLGRDKNTSTAFKATTKVRNAVTDSAVVEMLKEIKRIKTTMVSDNDLKIAKAKYLGNFIMALENPRTLANYAIDIKTENLPEDFYQNFINKINAVTKEDVKRVANKYFKLDNARIVVVGKGKDVLERLENITFDGKKIPIKYFDKYGNPVERPVYEIPVPDGVTVKTVFENYIKAIGGKEKLEKVKSVVVKAQGEMQGMKFDLLTKTTANNQFMMNLSMGGNSMSKKVFNGEKGYIMAQGRKIDIPAEEIEELKIASYPFPEIHYINNDSITLNGIEKTDGKNAYEVQISKNTKLYYDVDSGLLIKQVMNSPMGEQALGLADYKEVEGIKFPHTYIQAMGPQKLEFKITDIAINKDINKDDFK
ncbi:MAG: peptidase M16 [Flavobacteriales bacterium]|nr:MAG: peptidase M16 [Flavobacteriales bacterium]